MDSERFELQQQLNEKEVELTIKNELLKEWAIQAANNVAKTNQDVNALSKLTSENAAKNNMLANECKDLQQAKANLQ